MKRSDFPKDFVWGAATAAYQIEGGWNADGRGPSIWDHFSHQEGRTFEGHTGDIACDHYHRWEEDLDLMARMGLESYRFSLSWSRLLPTGRGAVNTAGAAFYSRLIDGLLARGIEPAITLYHWDLPQALQEEGGWARREIVEAFEAYARLAFDLYGDRVKRWFTHNEPWVVAWAGHYQGRHAPGIKDPAQTVAVVHHLLLSHARAVAAYRAHPRGDGSIGIVLNLYPCEPREDSPADRRAATLADGFHNRSFLDPLYKGRYPADVEAQLASRSLAFPVHSGDLDAIYRNPGDFLGINYYFRKVLQADPTDPLLPYSEYKPAGAWYTQINWEVYPQGLTQLLERLKADYGNRDFWITECGSAFVDPPVNGQGLIPDEGRRQFLELHFQAAREAIARGVRLRGFYVWSLLDNFEWAQGYRMRFGVVGMNYETLERIPKLSGQWLGKFLEQ